MIIRFNRTMHVHLLQHTVKLSFWELKVCKSKIIIKFTVTFSLITLCRIYSLEA